jgi:hypothetical protein
MASEEPRAAERRNIKKAQAQAKRKQTLKHLPKATRSALGVEANMVGSGQAKKRTELEAQARRLSTLGSSQMDKDQLRRAVARWC